MQVTRDPLTAVYMDVEPHGSVARMQLTLGREGGKKIQWVPEGNGLKRATQKPGRDPSTSAQSSRIDHILSIAAESFLEKGFEATSVNVIARRARASKETIYSNFTNKSALFRAVMQRAMDHHTSELSTILVTHASPEQTLSAFGMYMLERLMREDGIQLQKIISLESQRFPEISRLFYELGPRKTIAALTGYFDAQVVRGALPKMNTQVAAEHFMGLLTAETMLRRSLGLFGTLTSEEKSERVAAAIEVFLKAYGPSEWASP